MTDTRPCPRCGGALDAAGECPRCLLRLGLELPPRDPTAAPGAPGMSADQAAPSASPPPAPRPPPPSIEDIARRFPQLEIKALLGQGGMGVVYRARQSRLDREVALKVLPPELSAQPHFAERFLREARAMARLAHPNIVAVHDFGETDGLCWLMMELVEGVNLRQALKSGALAPEKALAVVPQMCDALQYAHDEGVVHRDIKPENVLLDRAGRVKIADFGLAKLVGPQDGTLTSETQVFGTPHYMAPEQMEGARDVDHRADIFSLGVVFYEMLTGRLPVGRFEPPSRRVQVDVRLDDVVLHALEHEPARRYQHAAEVKTDIESVAAGREPAAAQAEGRKERNGERVGERPRERKAGPPSGFVGVWLELPGKKKGPRQGAAAPADEAVGPRIVWGGKPGRGVLLALVALLMLTWSILVWRFAGILGSKGEDGVVLGLLLLLATASAFLWIGVRACPPLREALAGRSRRWRMLRLAAGGFVLMAGFMGVGQAVVEQWEHGTLHYASDSRAPLVERPGLSLEAVEDPHAAVEVHQSDPTWWQAWLGGVLGLVGGSLILTAGATKGAARTGRLAVAFGVPALMLAGLGLSALWSEGSVEAEELPEMAAVRGSLQLPLRAVEAAGALRSELAFDGYALMHERTLLGATPEARVLVMAFEPLDPWDRWSFEDGVPRRRRPHVELRVFAEGAEQDACRVEWNCGRVRPVADEESSWNRWIERILREAPRFTGSAAGG
jgi:hypothetical protein